MSRVGQAAAALMLTVMTVAFVGCASGNTSPEIVSLESRARVVAPGDSVLVECVAVDADADELTYEWEADRGAITGYAGVVAWTAPSDEGPARVTVTVSDGGEHAASMSTTVVVRRNTAPLVTGIASTLAWIRPGESVMLTCEAEDADGDMLTYTWSSACGLVSGTGATVTWTAPDSEGECVVAVTVDDGYDGTATASISVATAKYEPLLVTDMAVTPVDVPPYLVPRTNWYKVYWEDSYVIECFTTEPERIVSYEWSDGGPVAAFPVGTERIEFEGSPSKIRWTAPNERGEYTMTVTVRDGLGNEASKSITLFVESCTCGFPNG